MFQRPVFAPASEIAGPPGAVARGVRRKRFLGSRWVLPVNERQIWASDHNPSSLARAGALAPFILELNICFPWGMADGDDAILRNVVRSDHVDRGKPRFAGR